MSHASALLPLWYLPGAQESHEPSLALGCALPGPQPTGAVAASAHAWPAGQAVQFACEMSPLALPYVPSAQGAPLALTLPASHQYPCAQSPEQLASLSPVSLPYRPAGQSVDAETLATQ